MDQTDLIFVALLENKKGKLKSRVETLCYKRRIPFDVYEFYDDIGALKDEFMTKKSGKLVLNEKGKKVAEILLKMKRWRFSEVY